MNKLFAFIALSLIGSALAAGGGNCSNQYKKFFIASNQYFWDNCNDAAKAYFEQAPTSYISGDLADCGEVHTSTYREKCEAKFNLSTQSDINKKYYSCLVDSISHDADRCFTADTCSAEFDDCEYNKATYTGLGYNNAANQAAYNTFLQDLALNEGSTKCTDIKTNCSTLLNDWKDTCYSIYKQKCLDAWLSENASSDVTVKAYFCARDAKNNGLLAKLSFIALLAFFVF